MQKTRVRPQLPERTAERLMWYQVIEGFITECTSNGYASSTSAPAKGLDDNAVTFRGPSL